MGAREKEDRLQEIYDRGGEVYSISRLNAFHQCPYSFYLNYIAKEKGTPNIWAVLGGATHDALEACVKDDADESVVKDAIQQELDNLDMIGIDFPTEDIRRNWIINMTRFAEEWRTPKGRFKTEEFVLYNVFDDVWMQGYIDLQKIYKDGTVSIYDYKTSSLYKGEHLKEAGRQLLLYAIAKKTEDIKIKDVSWIFLKYADTSWDLKNGKTKHKISEWRKLVTDLKTPIMSALKDAGYDDITADCYYTEAVQNNKLDTLPDEVKGKFKTIPYVQKYEMTDELKEECLEYIKSTIAAIKEAGNNEENFDPLDIQNNSFWCSGLCDFKKKCKYYQEYCDTFVGDDREEEDLF